MRVSRKSWHYRLYTILVSMWTEGPMIFGGDRTTHRPRDLCHYFWTIVWLTILAPVWIVVALVFGIILGIAFCFYWPWMKFVYPPIRRRRQKKKAERAEERRLAGLKEEEPKEPGLIKSYLLARKQKVCPMITVVD